MKAAIPHTPGGQGVESRLVDIAEALEVLDSVNPLRVAGRVTEVTGLGEVAGISPDAVVIPGGRLLSLRVGEGVLGRVLNGLGEPMDGRGPLAGPSEDWPIDRAAPDPLTRKRIRTPLPLGLRAIDAFLTVGEGQRVGLFAGSGAGKSVLLGQIARNTEAEVNVICLVGERGREVAEFVDDALGKDGRARSVVICATSDCPSLVRLKSAFVATAIAEWFRNRGKRVLLMMDSLTRFARAQREIGLAAGELPTRHGYPPSVFAMLPRLLERAGNGERGSITALYTVLVAGGDMEEPIADEVRALLDGHIVLSGTLGQRNHWPAIDVLASLSRVMAFVADPSHRQAAAQVRELLAAYEQKRDLIELGAYQSGSDCRTDRAIAKMAAIASFLRQGMHEESPFEETRKRLLTLL